MRILQVWIAVSAISSALFATPSYSHHSGARYDSTKTITVEGTVREFQWVNPHVIIWVSVPNKAGGKTEEWAVQATSPGNLRRNGWDHRSLKPGDRVKVELHPLRDGGPAGGLEKVTILATGKVLYHFTPPSEQK